MNLFVSVGVWAMRLLYCEETHIPRANVPLDATNTFAVTAVRTRTARRAPEWLNSHGRFLNGEGWVRAFKYEVLKLTTMRTALSPGIADVDEMPSQELVWEEYHCCLEPASLSFHRLVNGVDYYYVPRFDRGSGPAVAM